MKISVQLDRHLVPEGDQTQRYLRIQIGAPESSRQSATRLPLNLALVIDRSGSMSGTKLEKAKEAAIFCLRNLSGSDRASVVAYDDEVRVVSPSRPLTPETKNRMISEVRTIQSGGSTNLGGGWLTGASEIAEHQDELNYLSRTILLSDGLANVGIVNTEELAHHAAELRQRGVSTTTMGIGTDFNEDLLERMAVRGGGHFYYIENGRQIPDFLHRELGEVLSTSARRVSLELETPEGVHAELLNSFEVSREGKHFTVRLDDMISGEIRTLVFKLSVRAREKGTRLAFPITVKYLDVETGETTTVRSTEAALTVASGRECAAETPDTSVLEDAALLEAAAAREKALRFDAAGDYAQSAMTLAETANYLRTVAPASPITESIAAGLDTEVAEAQSGFTATRRKEIHYDQSTKRQSRKK